MWSRGGGRIGPTVTSVQMHGDVGPVASHMRGRCCLHERRTACEYCRSWPAGIAGPRRSRAALRRAPPHGVVLTAPSKHARTACTATTAPTARTARTARARAQRTDLSPARALSSVDLPAPLAPTRPTLWPGISRQSTSCNRSRSPTWGGSRGGTRVRVEPLIGRDAGRRGGRPWLAQSRRLRRALATARAAP
jgi:hypothetical protein